MPRYSARRLLGFGHAGSAAKSFNDDDGVPEAGLRIVIDEARKAANINRDIAINEVADFTVLREAQREMGLK